MQISGLIVDFAPMSDPDDVDCHDLILDAGNDAPISDTIFPRALQIAGESSTELARIRRAQQPVIKKIPDAALNRSIEPIESLLGIRTELNGPGQDSF